MKKSFLKPGKRAICWMVAMLITLSITTSFSQDVEPDPTGLDEPDIPLDGGLSLLLVAGAALGGKKVYDMRKKKSN